MGSGASGLCKTGGARVAADKYAAPEEEGSAAEGSAAGAPSQRRSGERVLHASLVFRHGARGPGKSELKPFVGTAVEQQWASGELEELTAVGRAQMRGVGRWFGEQYLLKGVGSQADTRALVQGKQVAVAWGSSRVQRTIDSGECFLQGMKAAFRTRREQPTGERRPPSTPGLEALEEPWQERRIAYESDEATDDRFKAWNGAAFRKAFEDQVADVGSCGGDLRAKAKQQRRALTALCCRHGQPLPQALQQTTNATTDDGDGDDDEEEAAALVKLLRHMCYFHCMVEAERFWPAERGERAALNEAISAAERSAVEEMAGFVWQRRFHSSGWGAVIGGRLLADLAASMARALDQQGSESLIGGAAERIGVYSCHDYSLLSVLTALGLRSYDRVLGFGAHLLLELIEKETLHKGQNTAPSPQVVVVVRVSLNAVPFPEPAPLKEGIAVDSEEALPVSGRPTRVLELPLSELQALSARLEKEAAELLEQQASSSNAAA